MYVTTNSALVWKRMADENQQSARMMARLSVGLVILLFSISAYAYSTHSRYADLCQTIESKSATASAPSARTLGESIASSYCI